MLTLAHIFAYNSKLVLLQRASFSHAGTQMVMEWYDMKLLIIVCQLS